MVRACFPGAEGNAQWSNAFFESFTVSTSLVSVSRTSAPVVGFFVMPLSALADEVAAH
jgi:hypothetical protein